MAQRIFLVGLVAISALLLSSCTRSTPQNTNETNATPFVNFVNTAELTPSPTVGESEAVVRTTLATHFAERWGTYSSENNYQNIEDLLDLMTDPMRAYAEQLISTGRRNTTNTPGAAPFLTMQTIVRSVSQVNASDTQAEYVITTQRIEKTDSSERIYYQDLRIVLLKIGTSWKVDQARWLPITIS